MLITSYLTKKSGEQSHNSYKKLAINLIKEVKDLYDENYKTIINSKWIKVLNVKT
jgi:hypothetical protein